MQGTVGTGNGRKDLGAGEGRDRGGLEKELQARLDWYASRADSEEYDAKAVESVLYLLGKEAPLAEGMLPPVDEAWAGFQEILESRGEMLPLRREEAGASPAAGKARRFTVRHNGIAAAVLVALVLAVGGGAQVGARRDGGFFLWLKEDKGEKRMVTSPIHLKSKMEVKEHIYFDSAEVPDWAQEWLGAVKKIELSENYEWKCYETSELEYFRTILSQYWDSAANIAIAIGEECYLEKITYNHDRYASYDYVQEYKIDDRQVNVYSRTEESGEVIYAICSYGDTCSYFIEGEKNLEEIKKLMEMYLSSVKK